MQIEKGKSVQLDLGLEVPLVLAYPSGLFEARAYQPKPGDTNSVAGQPKFGATFCFPAGHLEAKLVYDTILAIAETNFSGVVTRDQAGNVVSLLTNQGMFSWPFLFGEQYANESPERRREAFRPYPLILRASTGAMRPPGLGLEMADGSTFDIPMDATRSQYRDKFWGGVHVWARIGLTPQLKGKAGVTAYLNIVSSYQTGERIQGFESGGQQAASAVRTHYRGSTIATGTPYAMPQGQPAPLAAGVGSAPLPNVSPFGVR